MKKKRFSSQNGKIQEIKFLTLPDWELFENVEEPPSPVSGAIFLSVLVIGLTFLLTGLSLRGKR